MIKVGTAINSFALEAEQADFVQPDKQVFVLSSSQLKDLIDQAVEKALQNAHKGTSDLETYGPSTHEEITALKLKLESRIDELEERVARELSEDRKRIAKLEYTEPQPRQKDRSELLRALIAAYGGKMLEKVARQKMGLPKQTFSMLIATMNDYIDIEPYYNDKRQNLLVLK